MSDSPDLAPRASRAHPWAAIGVGLLTLLIFLPVLHAGFVAWDDDFSIYNNPHLGPISAASLRWAFTGVDTTMRYIPLTSLSWLLTYQFWGLNPLGYHLGNWLLHGLNAALLFLVLRRLVGLILNRWRRDTRGPQHATWSAAVGALLWSLHPLRVEPVAWANARSYDLAMFFLLLSFWSYLHKNADRATPAASRGWLLASAACFALSLLSHPVGMGFVAVPIVLNIYLFRTSYPPGVTGWRRTIRPLLEILPFVAAVAVVGGITLAIRFHGAGTWAPPVPLSEFGLASRAMQAFYIWTYYVWAPWYPRGLMPVYFTLFDFDPWGWRFVLSAVAVLVVTIAFWALRRRWSLPWAIWICHIALLIPVLGLTEHPHFSSDRYAMVVSIEWSLAAALALASLSGAARWCALGAAGGVLILCAALSSRQMDTWQNTERLLTHTLQTAGDVPQRSVLLRRLGTEYAGAGRSAEALEIWRPLAANYFNAGRFSEAEQLWRAALTLSPNDAGLHAALGLSLAAQGRLTEAGDELAQAVRIAPDFAQARYNLAINLAQRRAFAQAEVQMRELLRAAPEFPNARQVLEKIQRDRAAASAPATQP